MCTTFTMKDEQVMLLAQNYDFHAGHGLIVVSTRDLTKYSFAAEGKKEVSWKTKYGNITFTQFGRELPMSGMNEKGLTIAMMYHEEGQYPLSDSRAALNELQWIQYQLDQYASVEEVVHHLDHIRIEKAVYVLHYMVADAKGHTAIIEFIGGNAQVTQDATYYTLTNSNYNQSLEYMKQFKETTIPKLSRKVSSLDRFNLAYRLLEEKCNLNKLTSLSIKEAFGILDDLAVKPSVNWDWVGNEIPPTLSYWTVVFDIKNLSIHYKNYGNEAVRSIKIKHFNFFKDSPILSLPLDNKYKGSIEHEFKPYKKSDNERIIRLSFKPITDFFPIGDQEKLATYPDTFN
ncbi:choloylglycine hydrolase [Paenibacillus amylolyticus]|uniref:Choloylglycine hydrolase n=2 Tax=Paenibacillus amylolyticus TaxID=1451 RepID=A0AAP5GW02_PAEAM|nr:choloylglycine hydrolase [Paenibacillus amylolyticus]